MSLSVTTKGENSHEHHQGIVYIIDYTSILNLTLLGDIEVNDKHTVWYLIHYLLSDIIVGEFKLFLCYWFSALTIGIEQCC